MAKEIRRYGVALAQFLVSLMDTFLVGLAALGEMAASVVPDLSCRPSTERSSEADPEGRLAGLTYYSTPASRAEPTTRATCAALPPAVQAQLIEALAAAGWEIEL